MRDRSAPRDLAPPADAPSTKGFTAFDGHRRLVSGTLLDAALAVRRAVERGAAGPLLIFDDATGQVTDVDIRGSEREVAERLSPDRFDQEGQADAAGAEEGPRRRGRPTLGVVAREVTLLPRHWEWLNTQPGGASATLRRLVEEARRSRVAEDQARRAREAAYRFAHAVAGDLPGFEEAARALFAGDRARFTALVAGWPQDVRGYAVALAFAEPPGSSRARSDA
jgi:uncharacterized protein